MIGINIDDRRGYHVKFPLRHREETAKSASSSGTGQRGNSSETGEPRTD